MNFDQILPIVYLVGVLILILPSFLQSNSKLKQLLTNLSIWVIIVLIVTTISYFLFKWKKYSHNAILKSTFMFCMLFVLNFFTESIFRKLNKHWYFWCPHTDSNREPTDYKSVALPIELWGRCGFFIAKH